MRGKGEVPLEYALSVRITPAYAGKRNLMVDFRLLNRDHPRVCGEKDERCALRGGRWGSPPRMRGKGEKK